MNTISLGAAVGSGFRLIVRRPLAFLAWVVAYAVVMLGPLALMAAVMAPELLEMNRTGQLSAEVVDPALIASLGAKFVLSLIVVFVLYLLGSATLIAAMYRAELRPEQKGLGYLRFGMDEIRLALLSIVLFFLLALSAIPGVLLLVMVARSGIEQPLQGLLLSLCLLGLCALMIWLLIRLSLAMPMTFAKREITIAGAWRLTRGRGWRLLGLGVVMFFVIVGCSLVLSIVSSIVTTVPMMGMMAKIGTGEQATAYFSRPMTEILGDFGLFAVLYVLVTSLVNTALQVIMVTPWASAYRQVAVADDQTAVFE